MSERNIVGARSVHLRWKTAPECSRFDVSLNVIRSHPGSFFMAVGWSQGYFGIQDLGDGHSGLICSVWDSNDKDPNLVQQAKALRCADGATVRRFGGEGAGLQCVMPFPLPLNGEEIRFSICAEVLTADWTRYVAWVFAKKQRFVLVDYLSRMEGRLLKGVYSFIEDFRRDGTTASHSRRAIFSYPVYVANGHPEACPSAKFAIADNPAEGDDYDARTNGKNAVELLTGGGVENHCKPGNHVVL